MAPTGALTSLRCWSLWRGAVKLLLSLRDFIVSDSATGSDVTVAALLTGSDVTAADLLTGSDTTLPMLLTGSEATDRAAVTGVDSLGSDPLPDPDRPETTDWPLCDVVDDASDKFESVLLES